MQKIFTNERYAESSSVSLLVWFMGP